MAFVDTSFLYAVTDQRDEHHLRARGIFSALDREPLTTTSLVLGEAWTLTGRRLGHRAAVELVDRVRRSSIYEVLHVDAATENLAFDWLLSRDEREYSFVDATSFQVMWNRRIDTALAFDVDFEAAGFNTLKA